LRWLRARTFEAAAIATIAMALGFGALSLMEKAFAQPMTIVSAALGG
jgi:hypothetical protein